MTGGAWTEMAAGSAVAFTALLFAQAALHKLTDFTAFTGYVADYRVVPESWSRPAAGVALGLELLTVAALVVPGGQAAGSLLAIALLLGYAAAIGINVARGRDRIECGCGGAVQPLGPSLVVRNLGLAGIAAFGLGTVPGSLLAPEALTALLVGVTLWIGYALVDQLLANAAHLRRRA